MKACVCAVAVAVFAAAPSPEQEFRQFQEVLRKAEPAQPAALTPLPSAADRARAEKDAADIFGGEVEAARKPADKAAVAGKMLDTARKVSDDPAGRWVLAVQARDLAVAAGDGRTAVKAAEMLAGFAPANGANGLAADGTSAKQYAARAHELWAEGERVRGQEQLAKRAEAAEWYFRALDGLEGLESQLAEKRLRAAGWEGWPFEFRFDGKDTQGWTAENHIADLAVKDGCLTGRIVGGDPHIRRRDMNVSSNEAAVLEFQLAIESGDTAELFWTTLDSPRLSEDKRIVFSIIGDGRQHTYRIKMQDHPAWSGKTVTSIRLDPGAAAFGTRLGSRFWVGYVRGREMD